MTTPISPPIVKKEEPIQKKKIIEETIIEEEEEDDWGLDDEMLNGEDVVSFTDLIYLQQGGLNDEEIENMRKEENEVISALRSIAGISGNDDEDDDWGDDWD